MTEEFLKSILHYNPSTGEFRWRKKTGPRCVVGAIAGTRHNKGYWHIQINGKHYLAHRLAWLYMYGYLLTSDIDHIDMDRMNNRIDNLRLASRSENKCNMKVRADNKIGLKGVNIRPNGKWVAQIQKDGKKTHLGYFDTPEEASAAYQSAAKSIHGDYARHD